MYWRWSTMTERNVFSSTNLSMFINNERQHWLFLPFGVEKYDSRNKKQIVWNYSGNNKAKNPKLQQLIQINCENLYSTEQTYFEHNLTNSIVFSCWSSVKERCVHWFRAVAPLRSFAFFILSLCVFFSSTLCVYCSHAYVCMKFDGAHEWLEKCHRT